MRKNKKVLASVAAVALLLTFGATTAFASDSWQGRYYTDADGDGICDNAGSVCQHLDADGDGLCDRCGWGAGWMDADGDGVCDYYSGSQGCAGYGYHGGHHGGGCGRHCR